MGCIYCGNWEGECQMWDEKNTSLNPEGADEKGFCTANEDPDPSWCQSYESDGLDDEDECPDCECPLSECECYCNTCGELMEDCECGVE
jgi:hypothetical protein